MAKITAIDKKTVSTIRTLCADTIQKANSGHPGLPLGAAPTAYLLYQKIMKHYSKQPKWINRDRFVLSGGHGSALLYSLLQLYGYGLDIKDLKEFRQLDSLTPGHPEYGHTTGVEATTGPLGAGMAMAVGMAMAQKHLASVFNKPDFPIIDNRIYVLGGDGCLMEGISTEAFSLAGTLELDNLTVLYDSNRISIEGSTDIAFREDVKLKMRALGFDVFVVEDGDDLDEILVTIEQSAKSSRPKFIEIKTLIGKGCPDKEGCASAHGEPLGVENIKSLKSNLGLDENRHFHIEEDVNQNAKSQIESGRLAYENWLELQQRYFASHPEMEKVWNQFFEADYAKLLEGSANFFDFDLKADATRNLSGKALNKVKDMVPNLLGGSADLAPSTKTYLDGCGDFHCDNYGGRNLHFGVRELAMAAIGNGMMLYGGVRVYVSTFFVFSDYLKPMVRLSALMNLPLTYVLTHDSIGVGEDGPTHQPIEQLTMLRAMPNLNVFRPCDAMETNAAWYLAMTSTSTPTALVLSRQNLPQLPGSSIESLKGGYVIDDCNGDPDLVIMASGSEVALAIDAKSKIKDKNIRVFSIHSKRDFFACSAKSHESYAFFGVIIAQISPKVYNFLKRWYLI